MCERGCPEETVPQTPELVLSSGTMGHSEVDVNFQCILGFYSQSIYFTNALAQADIKIGELIFIELTRDFKSDGGKGDVVIRSKKILYGQAKDACLCYEKLWNGLLERDFAMSKVDPYLFIYKTVIFVVYVDDSLFWGTFTIWDW